MELKKNSIISTLMVLIIMFAIVDCRLINDPDYDEESKWINRIYLVFSYLIFIGFFFLFFSFMVLFDWFRQLLFRCTSLYAKSWMFDGRWHLCARGWLCKRTISSKVWLVRRSWNGRWVLLPRYKSHSLNITLRALGIDDWNVLFFSFIFFFVGITL